MISQDGNSYQNVGKYVIKHTSVQICRGNIKFQEGEKMGD